MYRKKQGVSRTHDYVKVKQPQKWRAVFASLDVFFSPRRKEEKGSKVTNACLVQGWMDSIFKGAAYS